MKFRQNPESTVKWFLILLIPVLNIYGLYKLSKIAANIDFERGD